MKDGEYFCFFINFNLNDERWRIFFAFNLNNERWRIFLFFFSIFKLLLVRAYLEVL
jgi:hypothetical protein